ncbi:ribokinase [Salisediminibacterium halotolerans]|uniref:Ribokinase n=1 Tax=Salisediminibacterium halotolerans TaxID=517425 RepID=A0A1H9UAJ1_9BACI|nr:ribokinase [Salisediminibacterium haloalkalitolerans]SES06113.1 ribokinase [Salisediminibacterium haloalkalitolerans]
MRRPKVTVVGSINLDMVTKTERIPDQGETLIGGTFATFSGGKGANQAVAAARLGADTALIGAVGDDVFGKTLLDKLAKESLFLDGVEPVTDMSTGVATILLSGGDNRIIVTPGANSTVDRRSIDRNEERLKMSDAVLVQMEIPLDTIAYLVNQCADWGVPVIVNPAPAAELDKQTWMKAAWITPNETEFAQLFQCDDTQELERKLIVTKGAGGTLFYQTDQKITVPAFAADVVDTTGAGDTFNGALTVALAEKQKMYDAVKFANAAASLSVRVFGAQEGMPDREAVEKLLKEEG